jgi:hypothetical protein
LNVELFNLERERRRSEVMPYKDPDPTDPNMLVGVVLPAHAEATRDMAYVIAEEFARLGYTREQLISLFKNPFYGGAHGAYQALGEKETLSIIDECLNAWGNIRINIQDVPAVQSLCSVQTVQPPPVSSPAVAGEEAIGGSNGCNLRNGLIGAQRLNGTE